MNQTDPASKKVNWNKGLHRVFALLCVLWMGYWFVYLPWEAKQQATKYAAETYSRWETLEKVPYLPQMSEQEKSAELKENWERATWSYMFSNMKKEEITFFAIIALVPAVIYGLVRLLIFLILWLYRGFKSSEESS
jgi:hypothetical protein